MITFFLKHKNIIASLAAFAVLAGVLYWKDFQIERLEQKLAAAEVTAASYRQSLATLQEETVRRIKAVEYESQQEIKRTKDLERILSSIEGADDDENGTVSPVLRGTIDRLYGRDANNSGSR